MESVKKTRILCDFWQYMRVKISVIYISCCASHLLLKCAPRQNICVFCFLPYWEALNLYIIPLTNILINIYVLNNIYTEAKLLHSKVSSIKCTKFTILLPSAAWRLLTMHQGKTCMQVQVVKKPEAGGFLKTHDRFNSCLVSDFKIKILLFPIKNKCVILGHGVQT